MKLWILFSILTERISINNSKTFFTFSVLQPASESEIRKIFLPVALTIKQPDYHYRPTAHYMYVYA